MISLNTFNIPLETILDDKQDYDWFMKAFHDTVQIINHSNFDAKIDKSSADVLEMEALWTKILEVNREVVSLSLGLVFDSISQVLQNLEKSLLLENKVESFQEIALYLKYLSIPETMVKLLEDVQCRDKIL